MYQTYRLHSAKALAKKEDSKRDHIFGNDFASRVLNIWTEIENPDYCEKETSQITSSQFKTRGSSWKSVRLFVSSTFTDFNNEREILVKKVFPSVREWCETHRLHLLECDLRWGVPKDSTTTNTIYTCLGELQRCHEETDGKPFFLNMLGARYGWIPSVSEVGDDLKQLYNWINGVSITHMEILYGAYRSSNPNAMFFLRDGSFLQEIDKDQLNKFADEDEFAKVHLRFLKGKIRDKFPDKTVDYSCRYDGLMVDFNMEQVKLSGLEEFAGKVEAMLKANIEAHYKEHFGTTEAAVDDQDVEASSHITAAQSFSSFMTGREADLEVLTDYIHRHKLDLTGFQSPDSESAEEIEEVQKALSTFQLLEYNEPILAVTGPPGIGKTTLLSSLALSISESGGRVLFHSVGVTPGSHKIANILQRILIEMGLKDKVEPICESEKELTDLLRLEWHKLKAPEEQPLVIILDGVDQLITNPPYLEWLPPSCPAGALLVISLFSGDNPMYCRPLSRKKTLHLQLQPLSKESRETVVQNFFSIYNKKLDPEQQEALIGHEGAGTPMWLSLGCEELRIYGNFRAVMAKINSLPDTLSGLVASVVSRLISEDESGKMDKFLCLVHCSRGGLPEQWICHFLAGSEFTEALPLLTWGSLRVRMKRLLKTQPDSTGDMRVTLAHQAIYDAVTEILLTSDDIVRKWHLYLADCYDNASLKGLQHHMTEDLPHHLLKAGQADRLVSFFRKDKRSVGFAQYTRSQYVNSFRCRQMATMSSGAEFIMCRLCSSRHGLLGVVGEAKDNCVICGYWQPHQLPDTTPKVCHLHIKHTAPGMYVCRLCGMMFNDKFPPHGPAVVGKLCFHCAHGAMRTRFCCQVPVQ